MKTNAFGLISQRSSTRVGLACLASLLALEAGTLAQSLAPDSIANSLLTVTITGGQAPFAAKGSWRLLTSVVGTNYAVLGPGPLSSGTYAYAKTGPNSGRAALADAAAGAGFFFQLSLASATNGTLGLTNGSGFQTGSFTIGNYAAPSPPNLFLLSVTNGQFQSYLSGQPGFVYAIETSSDLTHWQPWLNVPLSDLTTSFQDAAARTACFYRARLQAAAFAPASLTNKTLNLTITDGATPLATNGLCQWTAGSNDLSYQIIAGPGTAAGSGSYHYAGADANSGSLAYTDAAGGGAFNARLVFTSPNSGYFYLTNATKPGYEGGRFTLAEGPVLFLGHAAFTADATRAGSLRFAADGSPGSLSVTNAQGWIWTLSLPPDALLKPRTITMTPWASVDSSLARLPLLGGVQLSPEGLQFCDPATLTVTPPTPPGPRAALLMGDGQGRNLYLVLSTNQGNSYSASVAHFSSAAVPDPSDPNPFNGALAQAEAAYANAAAQIKSLEKQQTVPPEPPDYDWPCDPTEEADQDEAVEAYVEAFLAKEEPLVGQLLSAAKVIQLVDPSSPDTSQATDLCRELTETEVYRKVDWLFSNYSGNPKKLMAVAQIALTVERQDLLVGGSGRPDWWQKLADWTNRALKYYLDQVRTAHMYSKTYAVLTMAKWLALLGVDDNMQDLLSKLAKALTFKLSIDLSLEAQDGTSIEAQGEIEKLVDSNTSLSEPTPASGPMNYVSGTAGDGSSTLASGQSWKETVTLRLNLCQEDQTADITLDSFGASTETWLFQGQAETLPGTLNIQVSSLFALEGYTPPWTFTSDLPDGEGEATSSFTAGQADDAILDFILYHTPQ